MNEETARANAARMLAGVEDSPVGVHIPVSSGTHHRIALLEWSESGELEVKWREAFPSRPTDLAIEARIGSVVYQRTTSPASAELLERYGVVLGEDSIDWGADADRVVDFGAMGDVTRRPRRRPAQGRESQRDRVLTRQDEEAVAGASPGSGSSAGGGSG